MTENKTFYFNENTNSYLTYCNGDVKIQIIESIHDGYFVWVFPIDIFPQRMVKHLTQKYFKSISDAKNEIEKYLIAFSNKINNDLIVFA
jgi:hypothetical protein